MDKQMCGGCRSMIREAKFMNCLGCNQKYDLQCANLSPKRYKALNDESKRKWRCLECHSKLPKVDNSNTPVRSAQSAKQLPKIDSDSEGLSANSNVTLRRRQSPTGNYITEEKMREILQADKQEMRAVIESIVGGLSEQLKTIKAQCTGYQESLSFVSHQYDELRKELAELKKIFSASSSEIKHLTNENKTLRDNLNAQTNRIRALEEDNLKQQQWSRIQNVEITGVPEHKEEDTQSIVIKLCQQIGVPIQGADIEFAHRVQPRREASSTRARALVVRLRQRSTKDQIVAAARKHRGLNAGQLGLGDQTRRIYINEHLVKENKMLLNTCKQKAKEANYKFIWTKNCRIYLRRNETAPPIYISSPADLTKIT